MHKNIEKENYFPNINREDTLYKVKIALGFACVLYKHCFRHMISKTMFDKYIGSASNNTAKFLIETMFICVDPYYSKSAGIAKTYILNEFGFDFIFNKVVENDNTFTRETAIKTYYDYSLLCIVRDKELKNVLNTKNFVYTKNKSGVLKHKLHEYDMCVVREAMIAHDLVYEYTFKGDMIGIVVDYVIKMNINQNKIINLIKYVDDNDNFLRELSSRTGVSCEKLIIIINSMLNSSKQYLYMYFDGDITSFRASIKFIRNEISYLCKFIRELNVVGENSIKSYINGIYLESVIRALTTEEVKFFVYDTTLFVDRKLCVDFGEYTLQKFKISEHKPTHRIIDARLHDFGSTVYCEGKLDKRYYVYAYYDPILDEVFYVGCGKEQRYSRHLKDKASPIKLRIDKIKEQGFNPVIEFLAKGMDQYTAFNVEKESIEFYGRTDIGTGTLFNKTEGGAGVRGSHGELSRKLGLSKI